MTTELILAVIIGLILVIVLWFCIAAILVWISKRKEKVTFHKSDSEAIASDWKAVGQDIQNAMDELKDEYTDGMMDADLDVVSDFKKVMDKSESFIVKGKPKKKPRGFSNYNKK